MPRDCMPSVTVMNLIKRMSVIFQQGLKQVLLKRCDVIVSSLEGVGQMNQSTGG